MCCFLFLVGPFIGCASCARCMRCSQPVHVVRATGVGVFVSYRIVSRPTLDVIYGLDTCSLEHARAEDGCRVWLLVSQHSAVRALRLQLVSTHME